MAARARFPESAGPERVVPAPTVLAQLSGDSVLLRVVVEAGAQLNALAPPELELVSGERLRFTSPTVTDDSAYFVGAVQASAARSALPMRGVLRTSFCRATEKLCRTAARALTITADGAVQ